jgi:hypothetical protein
MSRLGRWEQLRDYLLLQGLNLASEQGRVVCAWLWAEIWRQPPPEWEAGMPAAVGRAIDIYEGFLLSFNAQFMTPTGDGERWVRRSLRFHWFCPGAAGRSGAQPHS